MIHKRDTVEKKEKITEVISVRVTKPLKNIIEQYLRLDTHISIGDLLRDALREKIKRDAPRLYNELFGEGNNDKK